MKMDMEWENQISVGIQIRIAAVPCNGVFDLNLFSLSFHCYSIETRFVCIKYNQYIHACPGLNYYK